MTTATNFNIPYNTTMLSKMVNKRIKRHKKRGENPPKKTGTKSRKNCGGKNMLNPQRREIENQVFFKQLNSKQFYSEIGLKKTKREKRGESKKEGKE